MKAIMVMFDTLSRRFLSTYGSDWVHTPNFERLRRQTCQFDSFYCGSLPCMPARRELHTGRYNFLHRSWGPLEPFDVSAIDLLNQNGIYTHLCTDHSHYWEDGGATYLPKYSSWEGFRGQEGDRYVGIVDEKRVPMPPQLSTSKFSRSMHHNWANRTRRRKEEDYSSVQTVQAGLDFMDANYESDRWFLQIECFDPHEPFEVPQRFLDMYEDDYRGEHFDWPSYMPVTESEEERRHIICRYAALITMCDEYLGKVLDRMDAYDLWKDTMLIVNTDHGFLTGEHEWWGKNVMPVYNEIAHLPFYIHVPELDCREKTCRELAQTIDIAPTLLEFFRIKKPEVMQGEPLQRAIKGEKIHEAILFGNYGGHINICDGRYVCMRSSITPHQTLYEYTLMPTHMRGFFSHQSFMQAELTNEFQCFRKMNVLKIPADQSVSSYRFGDFLFDIQKDPGQLHAIEDDALKAELLEKMRKLMLLNEAPEEQFERVGLSREERITKEQLVLQENQRKEYETLHLDFAVSEKQKFQILMIKEMAPEAYAVKIEGMLNRFYKQHQTLSIDELLESFIEDLFRQMKIGQKYKQMFFRLLQFADKRN